MTPHIELPNIPRTYDLLRGYVALFNRFSQDKELFTC